MQGLGLFLMRTKLHPNNGHAANKYVYRMTDSAEFHANAADRTGSICVFKRHQNHEKRWIFDWDPTAFKRHQNHEKRRDF